MSQFPPPLPNDQNASTPYSPPPITPGMLGGNMLPDRGGLVLGLGIGSLTLNLLSICAGLLFLPLGCFVLVGSLASGIVAVVLANSDIRQMSTGMMNPAGMSNTKAGKICAIVSLAITALLIIATALMMVLGVALIGAAAASKAANP